MTGFEIDLERLRAAIPAARREAAKGGTMHGLWDTVYDAEAFLEGRQTLLRGAPQQTLKTLLSMLEGFVPKANVRRIEHTLDPRDFRPDPSRRMVVTDQSREWVREELQKAGFAFDRNFDPRNDPVPLGAWERRQNRDGTVTFRQWFAEDGKPAQLEG